MQASRIEDLFQHVTLGSLVAHAGGWCLAAQRVDVPRDTTIPSLWGISPSGKVTRLVEDASSAVWDGEGRLMAYLGQTDAGREVFLFDAENHDTRQLTALGGGLAGLQQIDSSRRRLLVLRIEQCQEDPQAPLCIDHLPVKQDGIGPAGRDVVRLGVVDLDTAQYTAVVDSGADVLEARWDASGGQLAYVQRPDGRQRHGSELWLRAGSRPPRQLAPGLNSTSGLSWSPDGRFLALGAATSGGDSLMWLHIVDVQSGHARRLDLELGTPVNIEWQPDGSRLRVVQAHRGLQRLVSVAPAAGEVTVVHEREQVQVQEAAARGDTLAVILAATNDGPELWLMDLAGGAPRKVTDFNAWRGQRKPLQVQRRRFQVPDGRGGEEQVEGWLVLPEGPGPFPLLLSMHGGPQVPVSLAYERHVHAPFLAERGWALLALNAVGSATYGEEFAHRLRGHWGELDYPQWQAAVRSLQDEGTASGQVAVFGHSYGGFLAAWALTHDPSLACGVVSAGVLNIESHAGTSDTGYYVSPFAMDGELTESRDEYRRLSPVAYADRIRAPLLILQGEDDRRCPIGQAEELFTAVMRHTDVPARLMRFPGGDHHVSITGKPSHRLAYFQALVDWLEAHMHVQAQDEPPAARPRDDGPPGTGADDAEPAAAATGT